MAKFDLNDYVLGENELYSNQGRIISMHISTGAKSGIIYEIEDEESGISNYYFEDEIVPKVIPAKYEVTLIDLALEDFYTFKDKRVARLNFNNIKPTITKSNNNITIVISAFNKDFTYTTNLEEIVKAFKTRPISSYAHLKKD